MISGIRGVISRFGGSTVFIDAGGIEYEVSVPLNVFDTLEKEAASGKKEPSHLFIHHHFGQDEQKLYGFLTQSQREIFRALIGLPGLGPGLALSLLSHFDGNALLRLAEAGDTGALSRIPRVGKKTAERLVFEIKSHKDKFFKLLSAVGVESTSRTPTTDREIALEALKKLQYGEKQSMDALNAVEGTPANASEWISAALRVMK